MTLTFLIIHVWNHFCLAGDLLRNKFVVVVVPLLLHFHFVLIQNFLITEFWNECHFLRNFCGNFQHFYKTVPNSFNHGLSSIDSLAPFDSLAPSSGKLPTVRRGLWRGDEWFEGLRVDGEPSRYSRVCSDPWPESNVPAGEALKHRVI